MHRGGTYKKTNFERGAAGHFTPPKTGHTTFPFSGYSMFYPAFASLFAIWLNNEPAQTVDVIVYGMQTGSETFSVYPCSESGNARNTVWTQHIDKIAARERPWAPCRNMDTDVRAFSHSCKTPVRLKSEL